METKKSASNPLRHLGLCADADWKLLLCGQDHVFAPDWRYSQLYLYDTSAPFRKKPFPKHNESLLWHFAKRPFRKLFSGLWIGKNSTDQRNRFQMIYFDFSKAGVSLERLEKCFETYCNVVLYLFIKDYASYYYDNFEEKCCIWLKEPRYIKSWYSSRMGSGEKWKDTH